MSNQPPSAPPPGQPPYGTYPPDPPGPDSPQLPPPGPPRKKRHWARNIFLGIGAFIVLIIIIAIAANSGGSKPELTKPAAAPGSAAPQQSSPSPSASPTQDTTGSVGDTFSVSDTSGDKYTVTLVKVIDPAQGSDQFNTPDNGNRFVGAVFTVTVTSGSLTDEDANSDASVTGSNSQTYTADFDTIADYTNFNGGDINLTQGQSVTGAVTFQVPEGVQVSRVQWQPGGFGQSATWNVG